MYETITTEQGQEEIVLGEFPQPDGISVVQWVFIPTQSIEHDDGSIEYVPSHVYHRRVYPNVDEF